MPLISIRAASLSDAELLVELGATTFKEAFAADNTAENMQDYLQKAFTVSQLENELNNENNLFFIAEDAQLPVGYIKINKQEISDEWSNQNLLRLSRIYVLNAYQKQKIGLILIQKAFDLAEAQQNAGICLSVWQENHKALSFYQRLGFVVCGVEKFILGTDLQDDFVMIKRLVA